MAKKKKDKEDDGNFLLEIAGETNGQTLSQAGHVPYYVDSGNLAMNFMMSGKFIHGGFPGGRIIEAFGPEASGKSLLGHCFMSAVQKKLKGIAVLLDCERSAGAEFAERCGHVDPDRLLVYEPITLEQVEKKVTTLVTAIRKRYPDLPIGIVWDSIGVNPTDREWAETSLPENPTAEQIKAAGGNERPGERARVSNGVLRKLNPFLNENNATLYVINQIRKKIGVLFGSDEATSGGGEALKFYASMRLRFNATKLFQDKSTKLPMGVQMSITNKKNRHFTPGVKIEGVPLFFDNGINPLGGLMDALLMAKRIEGSSNYKVLEPWANGDNGTFKQAKSSPMNPEILYRWPALVDAKDADEVKQYLSEWQSAIDATNSDEVEQIEANKGDIEHLIGETLA